MSFRQVSNITPSFDSQFLTVCSVMDNNVLSLPLKILFGPKCTENAAIKKKI